MSTARIKQISAEESEVFAEVGNVEEVALASMDLADSSGVMAAETAALVPNFNASRRLILFIRSSQTAEEQYHCQPQAKNKLRDSQSWLSAANGTVAAGGVVRRSLNGEMKA